MTPAIVWFRQDLRLADNPALHSAAEGGRPVIPLYILDDETPGRWAMGGAGRWWLHHALARLAEGLAAAGSPLVLRRGPAGAVLDEVIAQSGAGAVFWNRCYEPFAITRDTAIKERLKERGLETRSFNASLLAEPWEVRTAAGQPFKVFSPFWKALSGLPEPASPLPAPARLTAPEQRPASDDLGSWALLPTKPDWAGGLRDAWEPGESGAWARLRAFLDGPADGYGDGRNIPGRPSTSRLSPHLHFGEIGPRQVWAATRAAIDERAAWPFLREIGWREFSFHLLHQFPDLPEAPLDTRFERFPWVEDEQGFRAWCKGRTGFPIVDAGMRELWHTGWMHNRVRMIAASFLIKDLLLPWWKGEEWFWDTLVDADLANNAASWQWVAGCGADAAPYFRVFNPVLQGEKFDADGAYVRRWVPELAALPDQHLHAPWKAPGPVLAKAGVRLGATYPSPIVDHAKARTRALAAFEALRT